MISQLFAFPLRAFVVCALLPMHCAQGASLVHSPPATAASSVNENLATSTDSQAWPIVRPGADSNR
jgi:hypothetical protein